MTDEKMPGTTEKAQMTLQDIWKAPERKLAPGAWLWWFWLFFIHDENTEKTGRCRQLMVLWSVKNDAQIECNGMDICVQKQIEKLPGEGKWALNGAAAAWYFDGKTMQENFILEKTRMVLDQGGMRLGAPGNTPSEFFLQGEEFVTRLGAGGHEFEFRARQEDRHPAVGPTHGKTPLPFGYGVEGTRIEVLKLRGKEKTGKEERELSGTAYFQKILLAIPPPQWYWGIYHFPDGSYFTYMQTYFGRAALAQNAWKAKLKKPSAPIHSDFYFYHAPTGRFLEGHRLLVEPEETGNGLWRHRLKGSGTGVEMTAEAEGYARSLWKFVKRIGPLPARSAFCYNEYPAVLSRLCLRLESGEEISYENGAGNMENSWGFLV